MKKGILAIYILGSSIGFTSCEKYNDLFPEKYHNVLNIKDGGESNITLYSTGEDTEISFSVMQSGSEPGTPAKATVVPMNASAYKLYAEKHNIDGTYLPADYYTLTGNELAFNGEERYKFVKVRFKTNAIKQLKQNNEEDIYTLPLLLNSPDARVNDSLIIFKTSIIIPAVGFKESGYREKFEFTSTGNQEGSIEIPLSLPIDNAWDFDCTAQTTEAAKQKFEAFNGTNQGKYTLLPEANYSFNPKVVFKNGTNEALLKININKNNLERGNYVIPIEITECSKESFAINNDSKFVLVGITYSPDKIKLTEDLFSANSYQRGDGTGYKGLIDGLGAGLHFHSNYVSPVVDPLYGNYIDITLPSAIKTVKFDYWTRFENANGAPSKIKIFVSNDGSSWEEIAYITSNLATAGNQQYSSKIYHSPTAFTYFRFCVLESKAGSLTTSPGRYFNLGELVLYGN